MKLYATIFALAFLMCSCTREDLDAKGLRGGGGTIDFVVSTQTKASLDGLKINFEPGDEISVNNRTYRVVGDNGRLVIRDVEVSADNTYACIFPAAGDNLGHPSDRNYKWTNVQFYRNRNFSRSAMPLICYAKVPSGSSHPTLNFTPAMGLLALKVVAADAEIRSIRIRDNSFDPGNAFTYMSGRMAPYGKDGKVQGAITSSTVSLGISSASTTAACPDIVLFCNDAKGSGVRVKGNCEFYAVVPPRTYPDGFTVTVSDNSHRCRTFRTTGPTTVKPGEKLTMQEIEYVPDPDLLFCENFDTMVYGSDPVGMRSGSVTGYRGYTPRPAGATSQGGVFADSGCNGLSVPYWYGNPVMTKDSGGNDIRECTPGSDIYTNWHTNATSSSDAVFSMDDIDTAVMSESYIRSRGMWDWCPSRIIEFQGYVLVGKTKSLNTAYAGLSSTGSPQGALKTPALSNITSSDNVRLTFRIAKNFGSPTQAIRVSCLGDGYFLDFKCGNLRSSISSDSRHAYIEDASALPDNGWVEAEAVIAGATSSTHFLFYSPDGTQKEKTTTFYLDDIEVRRADVTQFATLSGTVRCGGAPVKGVAVSDGYSVVVTDASGKYNLTPSKNARFVTVSIPSGYEAVRNPGDILPAYYKAIDPGVKTVADFNLKKVDQSAFTLFVMSDSHVLGGTNRNNASDDKAQYNNIFIPAAKDFIGKERCPVYGIHLGDITQCEYWGKYSISDYYNDTKSLDIPIFHTIGNHDHDYNGGKYGDSHTTFESILGPRYYSLNIGDRHIVVMDNITVSGSANSGYSTSFSKEQIIWLKQDIALLQPGINGIIVCTHCPILNYKGDGYTMNQASGNELFSILKDYDVVCLTGHNHYDRSSKGTRNGHTVVDYVHPSLAGIAWFSTLADDGTPRSAAIYRFSGGTMKRSLYAFDLKREDGLYTIYNKGVDENTGKERLSENDGKGTMKAIMVNFPNAYSCSFAESTGGAGTVSDAVTYYDLNFRHFFATFSVSGKALGSWQYPTNPGHLWKYIPADPKALISIVARDVNGRVLSVENGNYISTKITN